MMARTVVRPEFGVTNWMSFINTQGTYPAFVKANTERTFDLTIFATKTANQYSSSSEVRDRATGFLIVNGRGSNAENVYARVINLHAYYNAGSNDWPMKYIFNDSTDLGLGFRINKANNFPILVVVPHGADQQIQVTFMPWYYRLS